jgi:hypothetical protein
VPVASDEAILLLLANFPLAEKPLFMDRKEEASLEAVE